MREKEEGSENNTLIFLAHISFSHSSVTSVFGNSCFIIFIRFCSCVITIIRFCSCVIRNGDWLIS